MKILHVDSSARQDSDSRALTAAIVAQLLRESPEAEVVRHDLAVEPPSHVSEAWIAGVHGAAVDEAARTAVAESDRLIQELLEADAVVIGVPMYNFSIPSSLKAWIDQVVRGGRTFAYQDGSFTGLVTDRPVYLALARAADYRQAPLSALDFQEPYLRHILGFIGLRDLRVVAHVHDHDADVNRRRLDESMAVAAALVDGNREEAA